MYEIATWADAIPDSFVYFLLGVICLLVLVPFLCVIFVLRKGNRDSTKKDLEER